MYNQPFVSLNPDKVDLSFEFASRTFHFLIVKELRKPYCNYSSAPVHREKKSIDKFMKGKIQEYRFTRERKKRILLSL